MGPVFGHRSGLNPESGSEVGFIRRYKVPGRFTLPREGPKRTSAYCCPCLITGPSQGLPLPHRTAITWYVIVIAVTGDATLRDVADQLETHRGRRVPVGDGPVILNQEWLLESEIQTRSKEVWKCRRAKGRPEAVVQHEAFAASQGQGPPSRFGEASTFVGISSADSLRKKEAIWFLRQQEVAWHTKPAAP